MLVETETVTLEEEMSYRGTPVLRYSIAYPQFRAEGFRQGLERINAYHRLEAMRLQLYARKNLYHDAVRAYLQAVESPGEEAAPRFSSRAVFSPEEFSQRLMQENPDVQLSGSPDAWLGETTRSAGGGAAICSIGGVSFSGTQLRRMFGLNSTRLTLSYQDGDFVFDVTGFGHRVGMSQYGAQTMARLGFSYQTILQYYYQGAEVEWQ